jgi:mannose-6-phosphate isomerase-like protein (cupin superfamily)
VFRNCAVDILTPLWTTTDQSQEQQQQQIQQTTDKKDKNNHALPFYSRQNLEHIAGNTQVDIDVQTKDKGFGFGNLQKMTFSEFCQQTTHSNKYYLTTQPIAVDEQDRPYILSQPLLDYYRTTQISFPKDVPFMPPDLQLMNINLWIGRTTTSPTSSRFHHDYHDNVYFLLKGNKKFRLSSFRHAKNLPTTHGTISKIYPNGRIVYQEQEPVREDGAPMVASELLQLSIRLEQVQAEIDVCTLNNDEKEREKLENELEEILQRQVDLEADDADNDTSSDDEEEDDDDEEDGEFNGLSFENNQGDRKKEISNTQKSKASPKACKDSHHQSKTKENILNFCQFDSYEAEKKGIPIQEVELGPGDVLYLPAGWYHEVFSSGGVEAATASSSSSQNNNSDQISGSGGTTKDSCTTSDWHPNVHVAMNYWYFPPNTDSSLEKPYHDDFWKYHGQQE